MSTVVAANPSAADLEAVFDRYRNYTSLPAMFLEKAAEFPDRPFVFAKRAGRWEGTTYGIVAGQTKALAKTLRQLGLETGDRVILAAENRPEWAISDLAVMMAGGVSVPAYTTHTTADHRHQLTDSGARGVILSNAKIAERLLPALADAPEVRFVIAMEPLPEHLTAGLKPTLKLYDDAIDAGVGPDDEIEAIVKAQSRTDLSCLIYTSGTGGTPKGVMLSHGAILCNCLGAYDLLAKFGLDEEVFLSFLPLSHSYEHTAGLMFPISIGAQIYYAESIDKLVENMAEVRPTVMTAVPRLYESMQSRIMRGVEKTGGLKKTLFLKTLEIGRKRYDDPASLTLVDKALDPLLTKLVRSKVADRFGGRLKGFVSGGAPLNEEVGKFFIALGLKLLQGYGQTESAPLISCNPPQKVKIHTVGLPCPDIEVKIAEDGEILVRGELVMQGYWNRPEETAATVKDGWLHTGDIGAIDADGYLQITDRKKDIIVLSGGDNVSPQRVEGFLALQPEISQALVYGDKRPHLVALLVPDPEWLKSWAHEHGKGNDLSALAEDSDLKKALSDAVDRSNKDLAVVEKVRRFAIAPEAFTIDNKMMTPTMKVRRHAVKDVFGDRLEALYKS